MQTPTVLSVKRLVKTSLRRLGSLQSRAIGNLQSKALGSLQSNAKVTALRTTEKLSTRPKLAPVSNDDTRIVIACMPKSGSTFLRQAIAHLPGMRMQVLVPGYRRREQELCIKQLEHAEFVTTKTRQLAKQEPTKFNGKPCGYVAHMHLRYSEPTADIISHYHLKPVVLVRNIFDIVPSIRDHFRNEALFMSMAYASAEMKEWSDDQIHHFIAEMAIPWYINFFMCWQECDDKLLISYEQLMADKPGTMAKVLDFAGYDYSMDDIESALETGSGTYTRKNKGVSGRGSELSEEVKDKIRKFASHYPDTDFSLIGL